MRLALQTIVFGKEVTDFVSMCRDIKRAGYSGIELFQDFTQDCYKKPGIDGKFAVQGILDAMKSSGLTLAGVASGDLRERIAFVKEYSRCLHQDSPQVSVPYVYIDEWNETCKSELHSGVKLAMHPHMFRPIQTIREAEQRLDQFPAESYPNLQLMPDTAHLTIAGDNPVEVVKKHFQRIQSLHVKDWNPNVGRSYQFYASGFCGLGDGQVLVRDTLDHLWKRQYRGWLVVEHDHSTTPQQTISDSRAWLEGALPPTAIQHS